MLFSSQSVAVHLYLLPVIIRTLSLLCCKRFEMKWSKVELERSHIVVCEDIGTLTVTLKRKGALDQMAFVGIKVREMSAKQGRDFIASSAQQVQFNPGTC